MVKYDKYERRTIPINMPKNELNAWIFVDSE